MNWQVPLIVAVLVALGWLAIIEAVTPDQMDLDARRAKVIYGFDQ